MEDRVGRRGELLHVSAVRQVADRVDDGDPEAVSTDRIAPMDDACWIVDVTPPLHRAPHRPESDGVRRDSDVQSRVGTRPHTGEPQRGTAGDPSADSDGRDQGGSGSRDAEPSLPGPDQFVPPDRDREAAAVESRVVQLVRGGRPAVAAYDGGGVDRHADQAGGTAAVRRDAGRPSGDDRRFACW